MEDTAAGATRLPGHADHQQHLKRRDPRARATTPTSSSTASPSIGGTLKTSAGGDILFIGAGNVFSGGTIAAGSLVGISNNASLTISGIINNSGVIDVDPPVTGSGVLLVGSSSATLQGGGNVRMDGINAFIEAVSGGDATLINVNNTISGAGMIGAATAI